MSTDITQVDAETDVAGHVTAPRCILGSKTCNFEITYKDNDSNKPLEMYVTLPIKYATKTNKSGYQKYNMRSVIEAIQELNRRTATFSCNAHMKTAIDMFDTADNDVKIFYCDQEMDGLPAASNGDMMSLVCPLRLIVEVHDGNNTSTITDGTGEYTVEELSTGWDNLNENSESFRQLVKMSNLELNYFQPFDINSIDYDELTYTAIYEVPPPISLDVQYNLRIGDQISTDTWLGNEIWYNWDGIISSEPFISWATGKPCGCSGIEYLHPRSSDIDSINHIVNVPYKHTSTNIPTDARQMDSIIFAVKIEEGIGEARLPLKVLKTTVANASNGFNLRICFDDNYAGKDYFCYDSRGTFNVFYNTNTDDIDDSDNPEGDWLPASICCDWYPFKFDSQAGGKCNNPDIVFTWSSPKRSDYVVPYYASYCPISNEITILFKAIEKDIYNFNQTAGATIDTSKNTIVYCGWWSVH